MRSERKIDPKRKHRGFTAVEVIMTVFIMGLVLMIAAPNFATYQRTGKSLALKEKHKMVVVAIQAWVQDNKISFQRPGDFDVENSQGRTVLDYLTDQEFQVFNRHTNALLMDDDCRITFENGVLISEDLDSEIFKVHTVFEAEDPKAPPSSIKLKDMDLLRNVQRHSAETDAEYERKVKDKTQKKLLIREDNKL